MEMDNLKKLRSAFSSLVLVLNVPGSISVQDLEAACADAILLMGQAGQEEEPPLPIFSQVRQHRQES